MDSYDLALIRELQARVAQLEQNVGMLQYRVETLQKQAADAEVRSTVVLEELADSQSAWDGLGSEKDTP